MKRRDACPTARTNRPPDRTFGASAAADTVSRTRRPIEFGWLAVGNFSAVQLEGVRTAKEHLSKQLSDWFPQFRWTLPLVRQPSMGGTDRDEPASRLQEGVQARDVRGWDFALVVTPNDLKSYYKSYAFAVPSRALSVAVLSIARLAPGHAGGDSLARRIAALTLHLFGDLNGIWHREQPEAVMHPPESVEDLDRDRYFDGQELEALAQALSEVADLRLEEAAAPTSTWRFYLRAARERSAEIASAVVQARPWEFPLRLSRLTAAAFSALFVLLLTAEVWDLGTSQSGTTIAAMSVLVLSGTTAYILARQKLLLRRVRGGVSEQSVVMNVSATLVVLLGMLTTYASLFVMAVGIGLSLFGAELIHRWAPAVPIEDPAPSVLVFAGLVSSLGLLIGSLGATFEGQHYFRHVIYSDEET